MRRYLLVVRATWPATLVNEKLTGRVDVREVQASALPGLHHVVVDAKPGTLSGIVAWYSLSKREREDGLVHFMELPS